MCHFHVVASTLSLPRCRFHVVASTLSLFYRGITFKFLTKILTVSLLFYNMRPPPVISTLSLPRCRFHVVASTLSLPRCRFHVVAIRVLQPCIHIQHGGDVLLADFSNFFMSVLVRALRNSWISLQQYGRYLKM